jgi:hypothetical protein
MIELLAAGLILNDQYAPISVAWLCKDPRDAAQLASLSGTASPSELKAARQAGKCDSWEGGTLNIRATRKVKTPRGTFELAMIRLSNVAPDGSWAPAVEYWVDVRTITWSAPSIYKK